MASVTRYRGAFTAPSSMPFISSERISFQAKVHSKPRKKAQPALLSFDEIPPWIQDNEYILHGYRPPSNSIAKSVASWTYVHNETGNIFTHMIPAICFLAAEILLYRYFRVFYPEASETDRLVFAFLFFAAILCMGLSTAYHTLMNHSARVSELWLRIDYVGIVGLILGNILSGTYMVFYCERKLQAVYWVMTLGLSFLSSIILLHPRFQGRDWRTFRALTFVCTGLSAVAPLAHATLLFGVSGMLKRSGLPYYLVEGALHLIGVFFYATRIPESIKPGRFDLLLSSHQIFHTLVVLATIAQVFGVWHAFDYNYTHKPCALS